ncbi:MAG TPA: shikimate dehydrogenase [Patescibacteria group bacterium]|nr:shikimate dehydrogenase [Patescibacteria group bacterium]
MKHAQSEGKPQISSRTRTLGILGWPLGHSLSPIMQNAAFAAGGQNCVYLAFPVAPEQLSAAVMGMKALGFMGANVTIPHKIAIQEYLDDIAEDARLAGAVNTLVFREGRVTGHNTDAGGFMAALPASLRTMQGKSAVVLGAGGAARAVVAGLVVAGCRKLTVVARTPERGQELAASFNQMANITLCGWQDSVLNRSLADCSLLVNSTPLGMSPEVTKEPPVDWAALAPAAVVCDLVYNPRVTRFLERAQARGHQVVSGDGMLLEQGILAYQLWTGQEAPRQRMQEALKAALTGL